MKNKPLESVLYSTIGVIALLLILIAVNFLAGRVKQRVDLTAEKAYTLSPGTRAILAKLDTPVQIRFYATRSDRAMPVFLKTYAQRVEDLLDEYRQAAKGNIEIRKLDPQPDSDAEDSANLDGVEGQALPTGERIYLGLSISMLDEKEAIPFLTPTRERLLEYDLSRAIARVTAVDKPVVGVMSSLPAFGMPPMMMMQMGQQGQEAWAFISELKRDFETRQIEITAEEIPEEVKVLVVIHPKDISEPTQWALDQFVLRGGKLMAFLDPLCVLDSGSRGMMGGSPPSSSTLDRLLRAWGVAFGTDKVVADMTYLGRTRQGRAPAVLALTEEALNEEDIVTADADNLFMVFAGAFSGTPAEGLTQTVLVKSSTQSELIDPMMAQMGGEQIVKNFNASGIEHPIAIRLTGRFKTAFPEGKPKASETAESEGTDEEEAGPAAETGLKESAEENTVVLFGDADMIQDPIAVSEMPNPFTGQRLLMPANGNLSVAQSAVEQLAGDSNLIAVRSRASRERPFTVVRQMQADAEAAYRNTIREIEQSLAETQRKLTELQQTKESGQRYILSSEQQQELDNFRQKEADVKKELKETRKRLRTDIDALETRLKWLNIAAMPALVALAGIGFAIFKRKRAGAK